MCTFHTVRSPVTRCPTSHYRRACSSAPETVMTCCDVLQQLQIHFSFAATIQAILGVEKAHVPMTRDLTRYATSDKKSSNHQKRERQLPARAVGLITRIYEQTTPNNFDTTSQRSDF